MDATALGGKRFIEDPKNDAETAQRVNEYRLFLWNLRQTRLPGMDIVGMAKSMAKMIGVTPDRLLETRGFAYPKGDTTGIIPRANWEA